MWCYSSDFFTSINDTLTYNFNLSKERNDSISKINGEISKIKLILLGLLSEHLCWLLFVYRWYTPLKSKSDK